MASLHGAVVMNQINYASVFIKAVFFTAFAFTPGLWNEMAEKEELLTLFG